jgi:hypothetical protein
MAEFTTLPELISLIGERRAIELFDDDNNSEISASEDAVVFAMGSANAFVKSTIYRKGFSATQIDALTADLSLRRYATAIFAQYAGQRKPEFFDQLGKGPFDAMGVQARKDLASVATGELRSLLEETAGANPIVSGETNLGTPPFIVSRDPRCPGDPGPGGF